MSISVCARRVSPSKEGVRAARFFRDMAVDKKVNINLSDRGVKVQSVRAEGELGAQETADENPFPGSARNGISEVMRRMTTLLRPA